MSGAKRHKGASNYHTLVSPILCSGGSRGDPGVRANPPFGPLLIIIHKLLVLFVTNGHVFFVSTVMAILPVYYYFQTACSYIE